MSEDLPTRSNYIPAPHFFNLNHACCIIHDAFGEPPYLVGSSLTKRDFRDVDVRLILDDTYFKHMFGRAESNNRDPLWSLICSSISMYLQRHSDLPIDFQIQSRSEADQYKGNRNPLGIVYTAHRPDKDVSLGGVPGRDPTSGHP